MNRLFDPVSNRTLEFAARFGFVSKRIFRSYLCLESKRQMNRMWRRLLDERLIFLSEYSSEIAYLTKKARAVLEIDAVPACSRFLIPHDEKVGEIFLALKRIFEIKAFWTEYELKSDSLLALNVLKCRTLSKIPDLLVEMPIQSSRSTRVAVELERTLKSRLRYEQIALSYSEVLGLDQLIFVCSTEPIRKAIVRSFASFSLWNQRITVTAVIFDEFAKCEIENLEGKIRLKARDEEFVPPGTKPECRSKCENLRKSS